ncbi:MAG: response regulator transcription factor [Burkholderiales bacterium]|nr:response regulator transcription factor [Burkholderiales bacterium]
MKILMVDDHVMFLQGLKNLLGVMAPEHQVDTASELGQALQMNQLVGYELVLLDWHLAEGDGGHSLARLREAGCTARIVVLSGEQGRALIERSIELGAAGFIPKTYSSEMMLAALGHILAGRIYLPADSPRLPEPRAPGAALAARFGTLTPRQREIYLAAARGLPNKLIARELGIAEATVKTHLTAVYATLGVRNRTEAAIQASRDGLCVA